MRTLYVNTVVVRSRKGLRSRRYRVRQPLSLISILESRSRLQAPSSAAAKLPISFPGRHTCTHTTTFIVVEHAVRSAKDSLPVAAIARAASRDHPLRQSVSDTQLHGIPIQDPPSHDIREDLAAQRLHTHYGDLHPRDRPYRDWRVGALATGQFSRTSSHTRLRTHAVASRIPRLVASKSPTLPSLHTLLED